MSLLGIGSAQIDLILPNDTYRPGDYIKGYYLIKGGTIEQQIKRIDCELIMMDQTKGDKEIIGAPTILTSKLIQSEQLYEIPFTFKLPPSLPISSEEISYFFNTKLTFSEGVESKDQDNIRII